MSKQPPDWYEEDVVCVAIVPDGQVVDWSAGSYQPVESVWPPTGTFVRMQSIARELNFPAFADLNIYEQSRLRPTECRAILHRWREMEAAVVGTPGAGWAAAIGLILKRCAGSVETQVLIEGP